MEFLQFMFSGFWTFLGMLILIGTVLWFALAFWTRSWRTINIQKHGWPPADYVEPGDNSNDKDDEE